MTMSTDPETVWIASTGGAYHTRRGCGRGEFLPSFRQFAESAGLEPCGRCADHDISPETVRDCVDAVETLGELADLLAVSYGEARLRAREAGVLDGVRDDIERIGVGK
jgi:hypothetical protein